ncbi:hypothetical protein ABZT02_43855 [Streptomyces sp. NPDC005402]|uniref:hypothetical protein n=1 Tax=Streptomyces sp. NPDC005402 TaxID=3155338 RepID=UPI0033A241A6
MLLRLTYLAVTNAFAMLRLLPMSDHGKDIEILARSTTAARAASTFRRAGRCWWRTRPRRGADGGRRVPVARLDDGERRRLLVATARRHRLREYR